ncbi:hypothetical protein [Sorangium sp. So ce1099]|uniref:hypothetical protein n=1 Tax=Sorangium sp. So ce1099 TaxID=3133331 RepID=UPI003F5F3F8A
MQIESVQSNEPNKVEQNPFLFERVTVAKAPDEEEMLAMQPGWCACAGRCNCFCGHCAACSISPN